MAKLRRPWAEQDEAFLREHYTRRGGKWCADRLGRTATAVHSRAHDIGCCRKKEDLLRPSNDLIDAVVRRYYTGERPRGFVSACAKQVGRTPQWVSERAADLGLVQSRDMRPWTEAEIAFVSSRPLVPLRDLARQMARRGWHRTPSALMYVRKVGLVETSDDKLFTAAGLAEVLGVTTTTLVGWIKRGLLKASRRGQVGPESRRHDGYVIHERDVARLIVQHTAHISLAKLEPNKFWLIDLLARHATPVSMTGRQDGAKKDVIAQIARERPDLTPAQIAEMADTTPKSVSVVLCNARKAEREAKAA